MSKSSNSRSIKKWKKIKWSQNSKRKSKENNSRVTNAFTARKCFKKAASWEDISAKHMPEWVITSSSDNGKWCNTKCHLTLYKIGEETRENMKERGTATWNRWSKTSFKKNEYILICISLTKLNVRDILHM